MLNKIAIIRDKLELYNQIYISKDLLTKLLSKFAWNYTISQLCDKWLIIPIKRGKWYINNKSREFINPYIVWDLYMWDELYMYGWMVIYNRYGLSDQVAEKYTIYNTKISGNKIIWGVNFIFIRQRDKFFYWLNKTKVWEYEYKIMTIERAFIQALKEKKQFEDIPYWVDIKKTQKLAKEYSSQIIINKINKLCS